MAQEVAVELIDDLDGAPIPAGKGGIIDFGVDGVGYSIDLGPTTPRHSAHRSTATSSTPHTPADAATAAPAGSRATGRTATRAVRKWAHRRVRVLRLLPREIYSAGSRPRRERRAT